MDNEKKVYQILANRIKRDKEEIVNKKKADDYSYGEAERDMYLCIDILFELSEVLL